MTVNLEELKKEISYKLRQGPGGKQYAYIDARQVADLLDEVVGPSNWKDEFQLIGENLFCGLSIKIDNEWVTKWDVGTESNIEEEKGQASDAFKRSAVKWGVGRFLYSLDTKNGNGHSPTLKQSPAKEHNPKPVAESNGKESNEDKLCSDKQRKMIWALVCQRVGKEKAKGWLNDYLSIKELPARTDELTFKQASELIQQIQDMP